jgi:hypothetical protein
MNAEPGRTPSVDDRTRLARFGGPLLGLLGVEFLLGMGLDQFVSLPTGTPAQVLAGSPLLDVHLVVGALLLGFAANILRTSIRAHEPRTMVVASVGLVSAVVAVATGLAFAFAGQAAVDSYVMSVGFLGMVVEAGYLLWRYGPTSAPPSSRSSSERA